MPGRARQPNRQQPHDVRSRLTLLLYVPPLHRRRSIGSVSVVGWERTCGVAAQPAFRRADSNLHGRFAQSVLNRGSRASHLSICAIWLRLVKERSSSAESDPRNVRSVFRVSSRASLIKVHRSQTVAICTGSGSALRCSPELPRGAPCGEIGIRLYVLRSLSRTPGVPSARLIRFIPARDRALLGACHDPPLSPPPNMLSSVPSVAWTHDSGRSTVQSARCRDPQDACRWNAP